MSRAKDLTDKTFLELETYFSRTLAITLFTLSLLPILLTGLIPLQPLHKSHDPDSPHGEGDDANPYAAATTYVTTTYHIASLIYCYLTYQSTNSVCFAFGMVGSGGLASWGVLALIFGGGGDDGRGTGKKVSGWPFRNREEREAKAEKMRRRKGI